MDKRAEVKERSEIQKEDTWNLDPLFKQEEDFEKALRKDFLKAKSFKGTLGDGPKNLLSFFTMYFEASREISSIYTYAHLNHDTDTANEKFKNAYDRATSVYYQFAETFSFVEPEILSLDESVIKGYLESSELKPFHFYLQKIFSLKPHTLSSDKEELLAFSAKALSSSYQAFGAMNNADLTFESVTDKKGVTHEISHGSYQLLMQSQDRDLRKESFLSYHKRYLSFENTLTELLGGKIQAEFFQTKARNYNSCLEASLFPHQIEKEVYKSLIKASNENIDALHKYVDMRKNALGIDKVHAYDMYVPLSGEIDLKFTLEEAKNLVVDSVAPLGKEYQEVLRKGLFEERWLDPYENKRKRSGAYSSGCFDSPPYMLMNFKGTTRDVMTLAHEAGHSMHSYYSHKHQPYQYSSYPIFLAEIASTYCEELLFNLLLERLKTKEEKRFLLSQKIDDLRSTFFRQTLFAEFELMLYEMAEQSIPLTPTVLKEKYIEINKKYYGEHFEVDEELGAEFLRVPHFYYNFYVYQYATGISAAFSFLDRSVEDYLTFISGGSSKYPIDLLKSVGVDMKSDTPFKKLIERFRALLKDLEA